MKLIKMAKVFVIALFLLHSTNLKLIAGESNENEKSTNENSIHLIANFNSLKNQYQFDLLNKKFSKLNSTTNYNIESENDSYKSPWLAWGLAMMFPGLGQIYNGEYGKLAIIYGAALAGAGLGVIAISNSSWGTSKHEPSYVAPLFEIGVGLISLAWLYSIIDAPISANSINDTHKKAFALQGKKFIENRIMNVGLSVYNFENCYSLGLKMNYSIQ